MIVIVRTKPISLASLACRCLIALTVTAAAVLLSGPSALATEPTAAPAGRFSDPADGHFDVSNFLDTVYGFMPMLVPITEPAVGYGAAAALVFIDSNPRAADGRYQRPNLFVAGGMKTENGTDGMFAGHLGTWREGRLRTLAAAADFDINLEFFGLGSDRIPGSGVGYTVKGTGGVVGASWRLGTTDAWLGARYASFESDVSLADPGVPPPGISPADFGLHLAAFTPALTVDRRDNFFTPTRGWYLDLSMPLFRDALGSDRDFQKATLTAMYFRPLSHSLYFAARATAKDSSDGTPFYLRPYVALRGVEAIRYQGASAAELEAELRWELHPRYSLVGFAGAGASRSQSGGGDESVFAGGAGFRYLIARRHGLHVGLDLAAGPDGGILYVIFGSAWMRP